MFMKWYKKYSSLTQWIAVLKRQPVHMQHVYAVLFAGSLTFFLAVVILYFDYGFWRDTYSRNDDLVAVENKTATTSKLETQSPQALIGSFMEEAAVRFRSLNMSKENLLDGKEMYTKEGTSTESEGIGG